MKRHKALHFVYLLNQPEPDTIRMCHIPHTIGFCMIYGIGAIPVFDNCILFISCWYVC